MGKRPINKLSQKDNGTIDIIKKKTKVPAIVLYFFNDRRSYLPRKYRYTARNFSISTVWPTFSKFNPENRKRRFSPPLFHQKYFTCARLEIINTFRIIITGQAVLPRVIRRRIVCRLCARSLRARRLCQGIAITAECNTTKNAISVGCASSVISRSRSTTISAATARTVARATTSLTLTTATVTR